MQTSGYQRFIYFPTSYEKRREPYVIFVDRKFPDACMGSADPKELAEGRFGHFAAARCREYNDELWAACVDWIRRNKELGEELKRLAAGKLPVRTAEVELSE